MNISQVNSSFFQNDRFLKDKAYPKKTARNPNECQRKDSYRSLIAQDLEVPVGDGDCSDLNLRFVVESVDVAPDTNQFTVRIFAEGFNAHALFPFYKLSLRYDSTILNPIDVQAPQGLIDQGAAEPHWWTVQDIPLSVWWRDTNQELLNISYFVDNNDPDRLPPHYPPEARFELLRVTFENVLEGPPPEETELRMLCYVLESLEHVTRGETLAGSETVIDGATFHYCGETRCVATRQPECPDEIIRHPVLGRPTHAEHFVENGMVRFSGVPNVPRFRRGDFNGDSEVNVEDPVRILQHLFLEPQSTDCEKGGDANDDGRVNLADSIYLFRYLFQNGQQPPDPFTQAGVDLTEDNLPCAE